MTLSLRFSVLSLLAAVLIPASTSADDVPFEQRVPDRIAAFASVPNFGEFKERFTKCSYGRLIEDPKLTEFRKQFESMVRKGAEEDLLPPGIELDDLLAIPSGELAFAITLPKKNNISMAISLDFGDSLDQVEGLIDEAVAQSKEKNWTEGEEEFQGVRITTLQGPEVANRPNRTPPTVAIFVEGSTLIVASSVEFSQEILSRWDGDSDDSLASNEVFQHVIDSTSERGREPAVYWYLTVADLIQAGFAQADPSNFVLNIARANVGKAGLLNMKAVGGTLDLATDGYDTISRTAAWVEEPVTGILSVFTFPVDGLAPPAWVPADASLYFSANWDVERAYNSVETLWDTIMGTGSFGAGVQKLAADERGPKLHIKLDVVDALDGRVHVLQPNLDGDAAPEIRGDVLFALEAKDPAKATEILEKLAALPNAQFEERTYRDTKIWSLNAGVKQAGFAVAHDCLMFSTSDKLLETVILADTDVTRLSDDEEFQRQTSRMPEKVSLMGIQRSVQQMKMIYNLLKRQVPAGADEPDPAELPEFEEISHYFLPGISYAVPTARGFEYVTYSLAEDVNE